MCIKQTQGTALFTLQRIASTRLLLMLQLAFKFWVPITITFLKHCKQ